MKRVREDYKEEGLEVLWIGFQDTLDKLRPFSKRFGIRPALFDQKDVVSRKFGMSYGAGLIFIDATGMVRKRINKGATDETMRLSVEKIIRKRIDEGATEEPMRLGEEKKI